MGDHVYAKDYSADPVGDEIDLGVVVKVGFDAGDGNKILLTIKAPVGADTDGTTVPAASRVYKKQLID